MASKAAGARTDAAKKRVAEANAEIEKQKADAEKHIPKASHPTPSQEEGNLAKVGASVVHKRDDGSGPDPYARRSMEGRPAAGYTTRQARPATASGGAAAS